MSRPLEQQAGEGSAGLTIEVQLDEQLRSLEIAVAADPGSDGMRQAYELTLEQRDWVRSLLQQARRYEKSGRIDEALERWRTLGEVHPNHADIGAEIGRLERALSAAAPATEKDFPQESAGAEAAQASAVQRLKESGILAAEQVRAAIPRVKLLPRALWDRLPYEVQAQIAALGGGSVRRPPAKRSAAEEEEPSAFKPMIYLGGGVVLALLIALFAGATRSDSPGPALGVQRVEVQAAPGDSEIYVDGELCGTGSCSVELEKGMHEISARLLGYAPSRQTIGVEADGPPQSVRLALEPLAPELDLTTDLDSGTLFLDGEEAGTVEDGEAHIGSLPFGRHEIRFSGRGLTMSLTYRAEPGEPLVLEGPVEARELKAAVAAGLADRVRLYPAADDVDVSLDGSDLGAASREGYAPPQLSMGRHEAVFSDGSSVEFEVGQRPMLVASLTSDRNVGALQIMAGVDDATVTIDGKPYRRRTARGRLLVYLRPGSYKIGVSKAGFLSPAERSADVAKGRRTTLEMPLEAEPQTATLVIRGGAPGTAVLVDGATAGTLDVSGEFRLNGVEPGRHEVELRLEGHEPKTVSRDFPNQSEVTVDGRLKNVEGVLTVRIEPSTAEPKLTLQPEGEAPREVEGRTFRLAPGLYTVRAEAVGFRPFSATVVVEADTNKTATLTLEEIPKAEAKPRDLLPALERLGWSRHGDLLVRSGSGFTVIPAGPGPGSYEFSVLRQRGRLYWAANYRDEDNHVLYQVKKDELIRTVVQDGEKVEETVRKTAFRLDQLLAFRLEVRNDSLTVRYHDGAHWMQVDRYQGANLAGRLAFFTGRGRYLGRSDQIGVRSLTYLPADD